MFKPKFIQICGSVVCVLISSSVALFAQRPVRDRITQEITRDRIALVRGNVHPMATADRDRGRVGRSFKMRRVTLTFKLTDAQDAALNELLRQQHDPQSPNYHVWLSPAEYAARFGLSANDRNKVLSWLTAEGFTIDEVAQNGRSLSFSGFAAQIESAFHTSIHEYNVNGETYYANATEPSVPAAIADVVLGFRSLNNFKLSPRPNKRSVTAPQFTSNLSGNHYLSPSDFATIYNLNGLYAAGIDGRGQSIVVAGQTAIDLNDIRAFRSASGLPANDPMVVLVPGSADPGLVKDDLGEADLDLEWAGAVAPNARLIYVNSTNVLDSLQYAIDQNLAPVASISYGNCERNFSSQDINSLVALGQQANAQGITIVAASGDTGAADCESKTTTTAKRGLAVDLPASLPYVTGLGGSEFREASTSWNSTNTATFGSALSYLPEGAWNDTVSGSALSAGGGGRSIYFPKPGWQSSPGVPNDSARDVPDVSFNASGNHDGYLVCSGGSCVNGFRSSAGALFVVGGTSVSAPTFAGIISLINQKTNSSQGNVNPILYSLAVNSPAAFHDITAGDNRVPCVVGTQDCPNGGTIGFSAGPGYDQATGLGSVDALNLISAWPMPPAATAQTPPATSATNGPPPTGSTPVSTPTPPQPIAVVEQGSIRSGYLVITPDTNSTLPSPTVTFGTVSNGAVQAQAGMTPIPSITDGSLFVNVMPSIARNLGVALVNPGGSSNVVTLTLRNMAGNPVGSPVSITLSAHQQIARFVTELFPGGITGDVFTGSLRLQGASPFGVLGLPFSGTEFSTSPVGISAGADANAAMALPQFALGGGWATQLALVNNGSSGASGRIDLFDPSGNPMAVQLNGTLQSSFTYSIAAGGTFVLAPRDSNGLSPF
jgi:subtilase family serine protease